MLLALLGVADRAGAAYAGRTVATQLQRAGGLDSPPDVTIGGFPFLTQALRGRYRDIAVRAADVPAGEVRLRALDAQLAGARVPLADALAGSVEQVPVDVVSATVLLSYADLAQRAGVGEVTVTPAGDQVRVRGSVTVLGRTVAATALSRVTLEGDEVVVTARSFEVGNGVADGLLTRALRERLDLRVRVGTLPYDLRLQAVRVLPEGVSVSAAASDVTLRAR